MAYQVTEGDRPDISAWNQIAGADILTTWLLEHPEAIVAAVDEGGVTVAMPDGLPLGPGHHVDEHSLLDRVVPGDFNTTAEAFVGALQHGIGVATVHLTSAPDQPLLLQYLDVRHDYGVVFRLLVPSEEPARACVEIESSVPGRPRLGFMTKDEVGTILAVDEATSQMLGWSAQEMIGRRSLDFIHPEDHVRAIDNWMARHATNGRRVGTARLRYLCRPGGWIWLETSNSFVLGEDNATVAHAQLIDVSSEMAATEALRRSEALLRRITDTVPVGLFHISTDGSVVFANPVMEHMIGREVVQQADLAAMLPAERRTELESAVARVIETGGDEDLDVELAPGAGSEARACQISLKPVSDDGPVMGVLGCVVDVTELKYIADTDALTAVHNRRAILRVLDNEMASHRGRVSVIFIDLDGFKGVNDTRGHDVGDQVLAAVAARLRAVMRPDDRIGRLGGDEFLVVCPGIGSTKVALGVASRLRREMSRPLDLPCGPVELTASFGVCASKKGMTAEEVVVLADSAMYRAKKNPGGPPQASA